MSDYLFLMHDMAGDGDASGPFDWAPYIAKLQTLGVLRGGSAMGRGVCVSQSGQSGQSPDITRHLTGYMKIEAESLDSAKALLAGNPVYEAGGVVEIRELPRTD